MVENLNRVQSAAESDKVTSSPVLAKSNKSGEQVSSAPNASGKDKSSQHLTGNKKSSNANQTTNSKSKQTAQKKASNSSVLLDKQRSDDVLAKKVIYQIETIFVMDEKPFEQQRTSKMEK